MVKADKVVTTVVETGVMIILEEDINKAMVVDQCEIISTLEADQHPTVLIWVLVADSLETRDGYRPLVDKVASLLLKRQRVCHAS